MATLTVYPDADAESTSVDGAVFNSGATWSGVHDATAGTGFDDSTSPVQFIRARKVSAGDWRVNRGFFLFDTSALTAGASISSAIISFAGQGTAVNNADGGNIDIVQTTPASNTALVAEDWDEIGTTLQATSLALSSWVSTDNTYNDLTLNATGLGNISKTGITKFGTRHSFDTSNTEPTGNNDAFCYTSDNTGTSSDPKLVVTYTTSIAYSFDATVGQFTLTGNDITINKTLSMLVSVGEFTLTGVNIILSKGYTLVASVGQFTLTGIDTIFTKALNMAVSVGQFTLTGISTAFKIALTMSVSVGVFSLVGNAITIARNGLYVIWSSVTKNVASWVDKIKNSATWNAQDKNL